MAKRWISEIHCKSQELIDEIICSQSDSSEEYECDKIRTNKKLKVAFPTSNLFEPNESSVTVNNKYFPRENEFVQNMMRLDTESIDSCSSISSPRKQEELECNSPILNRRANITLKYFPKKNELVQNMERFKTTESVVSCSFISSPKKNNELEFNSPILKHKTHSDELYLENESPILRSSHLDVNLSPVITNMENFKRIQDKIKTCSKIQREQLSPDLFPSQSTQIIEQNISPDYITEKDSEQIDIISSQNNSSITVINPSSSSGNSTSDLAHFYHQPNPKKKYYKKGGLLHRLKRTISLSTSRVSLWNHDIFLKNITPSSLDHINCIVKKKWKDFGCHILECCKNTQEMDIFLVCLGNFIKDNTLCDFKHTIKLFPPFKKKIVTYKNKEVEFYYNISKVLTDPDEITT